MLMVILDKAAYFDHTSDIANKVHELGSSDMEPREKHASKRKMRCKAKGENHRGEFTAKAMALAFPVLR